MVIVTSCPNQRVSTAFTVLLLFLSTVESDDSVYYMTELCDQTLTPTHDKILSHRGEMYKGYFDCVLALKTEHKNQSIAIDYDWYDMQKVGKVCVDYLAIYDGDTLEPADLLHKICGRDDNPMTPTVFSTRSTLTLRLFTTSWVSGREFSLKVSAVEYHKDCGEGMYHCDNDRCINESLVCDDRNNCGDNSDESYCQTETKSNKSGRIVLYAVLAVGGVVILTVLLFGAVKRGGVLSTCSGQGVQSRSKGTTNVTFSKLRRSEFT